MKKRKRKPPKMIEIADEGICFGYNRTAGKLLYPYAVLCRDKEGKKVIAGYLKHPRYLIQEIMAKHLKEIGATDVKLKKAEEKNEG